MNPLLQKYLTEKYGEDYEKEAQTQYDDRAGTLNTANLFSNLGDAIAGNKIGSANGYFDSLKKDAKESTLGKIDKDKKDFITDATFDNQQKEVQLKQEASDPMSRQSKIVQDAVTKVYKNKFTPEQISRLSAADADLIYRPLELEAKLADQALDRQYKRDTMSMARQDRLDAKKDKREEKDLQLVVPGYERTGEVLPKPEEAVKFRKATAVSKQLSDKLNRMKQLVKDNGSFEWGGDAGTEMESLATEIQLLGKSPELYELGVLAGPDLSLLQKITADPSGLSSLFSRDASRQKQIDSQLSSLTGKLDATASSLGYRRAGEAPRVPVAPAQDEGFQAWKKSKGL